MATSAVEQCKISPPSDAPREFSIPIVFLDMLMYNLPAVPQAFFFDLPACSKLHFLESIVPHLKRSLSQTLNHFLPLAGNIIHPLTPGDKPIIRYAAGDSVSLTVSESTADFFNLSGHHPRDSDEFYAFVPHLPPAVHSEQSIACPVFALQATIFPGQGVCISFVLHHVAGDASTIAYFMQAWGLIHSSTHNNGGAEGTSDYIGNILMGAKCFPFYDRQTVMNINGLDSMYWDLIVRNSFLVEPPPVKFPINKIRTTLFLSKDEIQRLKNLVLEKRAKRSQKINNHHLSSFTVACALVWFCSAKSMAACGESVSDDELEYLFFFADCRGRLNPPLPANYFGNCLVPVVAELRHGELKGENGFEIAVESIEKAIQDRLYGEKGILHGASDHWPEEKSKLAGKRVYGVGGSPKFDFYAVDFGWGKPKKVEILVIDSSRSISLSKSMQSEGGLEIGFSNPKLQMEAFTAVWKQLIAQLFPLNRL